MRYETLVARFWLRVRGVPQSSCRRQSRDKRQELWGREWRTEAKARRARNASRVRGVELEKAVETFAWGSLACVPPSYVGSRPNFARAKYRSGFLCSPTPRKRLLCWLGARVPTAFPKPLPSRATRVSRSLRFRLCLLCSTKIRKK